MIIQISQDIQNVVSPDFIDFKIKLEKAVRQLNIQLHNI